MVQAAGTQLTHRVLETLDLVIIAVYFVIVFSIGFYFARREKTSADYFLAGRNVGWFAIGRRSSSPISRPSTSSAWRARAQLQAWRWATLNGWPA